MEEEFAQKEEKFKKFKEFFKSDMKMKETLLRLAPTERDDSNEDSRINM